MSLLSFLEARQTLLAQVSRLSSELVPLAFLDGRVLAEALSAQHPLPRFDHSTMDGFALRARDYCWDYPLPIAFSSQAGYPPPPLPPGAIARIFTGAMLPEGADCVVPQEYASYTNTSVQFTERNIQEGDYLRRRGEEIALGTPILDEGTVLHPGTTALLAALDHSHVSCIRKPRVVLLPTGDELRAPGSPARSASIPEANSLMIAQWAQRMGAVVELSSIVPDDKQSTLAAIEAACAKADLVLSIGGVSVGDHDHIPAALDALGVTRIFYKVAIKPGKPLLYGTRNNTHFLALPGNPASALVTFLLFGIPLLKKLAGKPTHLSPISCPLGHSLQSTSDGRLTFLRGFLDEKGVIFSSGQQTSGSLGSLATANALLALPPETPSQLEAGELVSVYPFSHL